MILFRNEIYLEYFYYGRFYRDEIMLFRLKSKDIEIFDVELDVVVNYVKDKINRGLYNYLFIFDIKYKYYCIDLVICVFG